mgnify:CR=1 FL=1
MNVLMEAYQTMLKGEIATLPVVVLVSFLAQPQLQFAMATDGLLPPLFKATDANRSLYWSTALTGVVTTAIALFVPFTYLNDMISAGVLIPPQERVEELTESLASIIGRPLKEES